MATTIGNLVVKLTAVTAPFTRGLASASSTVSGFVGGVARAGVQIAKMATAAAAAGAAITGYFVRGQMQSIDATAKLADQLGFTTEQLVGLQHAADLAGVSSDELSAGMRRMLKNISDAGNGLATAKRSLDDLGLSQAKLEGMSPDEQFKAIADAFATIPSFADRARIAQDLFGRSGVKLISIMQGGAAGIEAAQKEAEKLGLTFSRVDAAKVEAANDAMTRLWSVLTGAARTLAIELSPFITAAANKLIEMGTSGEGMGAKVVSAVEFVIRGIARTAEYIDLVRAGWNLVVGTFQLGGAVILKVLSFIGYGLDKIIELTTGAATGIGDFLDTLARGFGDASKDSFAAAEEAFDSFLSGKRVKQVTDFFAAIRADAEAAAQASVNQIDKFNDMSGGAGGQIIGRDSPELPKLLRSGSSEAISFINQQRLNERGGGIAGLNRLAEQQVDELRGIREGVDAMAEAAEGDDEEVVAF